MVENIQSLVVVWSQFDDADAINEEDWIVRLESRSRSDRSEDGHAEKSSDAEARVSTLILW